MDRSALYHGGNRRLQDEFASRPIADRLEAVNLRTAFTDRDRQFIEHAAFFFLATADAEGQPNVSHKGGMPGFVRVVGPGELAYPDFDGNGMFVSLGNVAVNPKVGLLFIDFERPRRLIIHADAAFSRDDPLMPMTVGAQMIVRLKATAIYPNCPRYIPRMQFVEPSQYAPRPGETFVEPAWKSFPEFKDAVHPRQPTAAGDK
jgi:predicted pyridoxine 5'-phosphate oxidase superfamily flavin-nucleotide-binding protein